MIYILSMPMIVNENFKIDQEWQNIIIFGKVNAISAGATIENRLQPAEESGHNLLNIYTFSTVGE